MDNIYMICEVGQAHEGSITLAHAYIDAVAKSGINAMKFQVHIAEAESGPYDSFRQVFPFADTTRMAYWKRMEFTKAQWAELKQHCEYHGLDFIASPFSIAAVDLLNEIGVSRFKIGSGETENLLMLDKIGAIAKEIIVSSGMSTFYELDETIACLKQYPCALSILQCTTAYPTDPSQWGLNVIEELKKRYLLPTGFSDHSGGLFACLAAATLGARLLEFHVTFDKRMLSPDASSSLGVDEVFKLVEGVRAIEHALGNPVDKSDNSAFRILKAQFGKSLVVNKFMQKGQLICMDDLESKKPAGLGIPPNDYNQVLGKVLTQDAQQWDFITENHF
ncbi:N,N'-diacetyllegionaminic acid synthase [Dyadobacter sp. CECT 9623]|uniref:N,N'-diacetyllegionaminic acid synthase n=1 Tax=Dyadobacter linearis TaxID=2823330 RepID=A0ABM8UWT8_9BACT|nr:N-acetylneuraminate synthase family protein [Dyadobacter sp. CECT 9623]CAG5073231.1 N,N'-diacetyllegionaminic acid synthase [Dyadobacter sp. CECT 9623]